MISLRGVIIMVLNRFFKKKRMNDQLRMIKKTENEKIKTYLKKVYNPDSLLSKPKYRIQNSVDEKEIIKKHINNLYNPEKISIK